MKMKSWTDPATTVEIEPGDATRYHFTFTPSHEPRGGPGYLTVSGTPDFALYSYDTRSLRDAYHRWKDLPSPPVDDPYLTYITAHSGCNPWTARAMVLAYGKARQGYMTGVMEVVHD